MTTAAPNRLRAQPGAVGTWYTLSDTDGRPRGIVVIREVGGRLVGELTGSFAAADSVSPVCDNCPGDRKGKPVFGMEIVRGMRPDGSGWSGGEILDPDTGTVYRATMHLEDNGNKLVVRGYIGVSLFGRSQTWVRAR
jgi:uncharacterized protein (DUF2147 family)